MHHRRPRPRLALLAGLLLALAVPAAALAHPLGNFTINHYSGIRVSPERIVVDQVFDLAEIPALQALQPTGGDFGPAGPTAFAAGECRDLVSGVTLTVDGARLDLVLSAAGASLPPGQGGLPTLRLVCTYVATVPAAATTPVAITFHDGTYAERIGWREIAVEGDGVTVSGADATSQDISARLTHYPTDLLAQPLDRSEVSFNVAPGGPRLLPLVVADAMPLATAASISMTSTADLLLPAGGAVPASASASASVPGGVTELPAALTSLLHGDTLSPGLLALGLMVAVGLGALHALTPGHGKTIMAAYLVGTRGDTRQAIGLGATVATSHTIGVLVLAMLVLAASSILPPERLFPVLSAVSAILVTGIGGWLLIDAWRRVRSRGAHARVHVHVPRDVHDHSQSHVLDHVHDEAHVRVHGDVHDHVHAPAAHETHHHAATGQPAEHTHGGRRHSHLLPARANGPIRWRGIVTLGLAGGLVPSASAILLLLAAVAAGRPVLGLGLVVAFGLGMAGVLGVIGIVLVRARSLADRLPSMAADGRLGLVTSLAAATVVLGFGLLLVGQSLTALPF
jgi:ABC-type nickel/cobalt efflux system permease component RcnA